MKQQFIVFLFIVALFTHCGGEEQTQSNLNNGLNSELNDGNNDGAKSLQTPKDLHKKKSQKFYLLYMQNKDSNPKKAKRYFRLYQREKRLAEN